MRRRIVLSLILVGVVIVMIGVYLATQGVRNAPLTVGSGDGEQTVAETTPETTPDSQTADMTTCESLPGTLAFTSDMAGDYDIVLLNPDMTLDNLTADDTGAHDYFPSWSLAGEHINFLSSRLDSNDLNPSQIVMDTGEINNLDILQAIFVTIQNGLFDWDAQYGPGGERLLWASLRDLNLELYVIDTEAEFVLDNATRLTDRGARDWFAMWSPDGESVVFNSDEADGVENIYRYDLATETLTMLTQDGSEWDKLRGMWSLDGESIVYVFDENDVMPQGNLNLVVMQADGGEARPLAADETFSGGAIWTVDGRYRVHASNDTETGNWQLFLTDAETDRTCEITDSGSNALYPVWRP